MFTHGKGLHTHVKDPAEYGGLRKHQNNPRIYQQCQSSKFFAAVSAHQTRPYSVCVRERESVCVCARARD